MFIASVRLSRKRMLLGALVVALVISTGVLWSSIRGNDTVPTVKDAKVSEKKVKVKKAPAKTNEQRLEFIHSFGWETEEEPVEVLEVIIPKEFDDVYREYNSLQKLQGFDLAPYAGKRCKRYSYTILNYPDRPDNVRVNLLVRDNKVIGGDVCLMEPNGFMHGFTRTGEPQKQSKNQPQPQKK